MSSHSLSPRRPSHSRRPSTFKVCDFNEEHILTIAHEQIVDELETSNRTLRRQLLEKDEELVGYHNDLADLQTQLDSHLDKAKQAAELVKELREDLESEKENYDVLLAKYDEVADRGKKAYEGKKLCEEQIAELKTQVSELVTERNKLRSPIQKRSRSPSVERLTAENKRLQRESQDVRKRATQIVGPEWNSQDLKEAFDLLKQQLDEVTASRNEAQGTVLSLQARLEEANRRAEIKQAITPEPESDLSALTDLHPALTKVKNPTARQLADSLVEAITFDLNDIWSHLPHQQEEALVTPSTRRIDITLNRLKEAVKKDANLKLAPELAQAKQKCQELTQENQDLLKKGTDYLRVSSKLAELKKELRTTKKEKDEEIHAWKSIGDSFNQELWEPEDLTGYIEGLLEKSETLNVWRDTLFKYGFKYQPDQDFKVQADYFVGSLVKKELEKELPSVSVTNTDLESELNETLAILDYTLQCLKQGSASNSSGMPYRSVSGESAQSL
jgi:hypothetical protein